MVGVMTVVGVLLGSILDSVIRDFWPSLAPRVVAPAAAIVGNAVGWWFFATVGQRWLDEDEQKDE
jgi:hypothetical protein